MTIVNEGQRIGAGRRRLLGALATFVVFVLAVPLVGGGTIMLALLVMSAVPPDFSNDLGGAFFYSAASMIVPALAIGVMIAVRDATARPVDVTLATGLGATTGVVWALFLASEGTTSTLSILVFIGSTVATLICWWLTRLFVRAP